MSARAPRLRPLAALALAAAAMLTAAPSPARDIATREWNFAVSLDGRPIGEHRYTLHDRGDIRELRSEGRRGVLARRRRRRRQGAPVTG